MSSVDSAGSTASNPYSFTAAGQTHITGLGNGTDFDTMITQLVQVESKRITQYQSWKQTWTDKVTVFQNLNTSMLNLRTTLTGMNTPGKFLTKSAATSDSSIVSAKASSDAENATHTLNIKQIAQNKIMVQTGGVSNAGSSLSGSATVFAYNYKGTLHTVSVGANTSLTTLQNLINLDGSNPGVRASVIYDGASYHMQLRGLDTGSNATLTVDASTTVPGFSNGGFTVTQENQSALIRVDGWPTPASGQWISRHTNSVSDVITGMTLTLSQPGASSNTNYTINTTVDSDAVVQNVKNFVSQVNTLREYIKTITKFDKDATSGSILTGNYGVQIIDSMLNQVTAASALGFDSNRDSFTSLSQFGIKTDADDSSPTFGQLLFDETVFRGMLASNSAALADVFAASNKGETNSAQFSFTSLIQGTTKPGSYDITYTVSGGNITGATLGGKPAAYDNATHTITGLSGDMLGLTVTVNDLTADGNGKVYIKQGKTGQMADQLKVLTDSHTGPLAVLQKNYKLITDSIDEKIESEQRRITLYEQNLRQRFSKLDALLSTYSQQQTSLQSQIKQLSS